MNTRQVNSEARVDDNHRLTARKAPDRLAHEERLEVYLRAPGVARLKILAKCCRTGVLSYISLVFPPVFTTCDLEAEFWVAEADMQLISVPYNHRVVRYRIGLLSYSILPVF
jgi:hypothetical protein